MKKYLIILTLILIVAIVVAIALLPKKEAATNTTELSPIPTSATLPTITTSGGSVKSDDYSTSQAALDKQNQDYLVSKLMNIVPYRGKHFSFDFNFDSATFLLALDKTTIDEGNVEFETFLKQNGVQGKSWLGKLITSYY